MFFDLEAKVVWSCREMESCSERVQGGAIWIFIPLCVLLYHFSRFTWRQLMKTKRVKAGVKCYTCVT